MSNYINRPIGEIIAEDFRKAGVLSRYGIDFCCGGEKSLESACSEKSIDPQRILQGLEADLHQHIHLENNILFPKVLELQREMVGKE